jgi:hypothetical protein
MATEPRLPTQWYDGEGPERPSDEPPAMLAEIEALRSRVAAQDAELTRLRGLVAEAEPYLGMLSVVAEDWAPANEARLNHLYIRVRALAEARAEVPR